MLCIITQKCFNKRDKFYGNGGAASVEEDTDWTLLRVSKLTFRALALRQGEENEVLTLETSALKLLTVADLSYQLSWQYQITLFKKSGHSRARTHEWGISSQKSRDLKAITPMRFNGVKDG